MAGRGGSCACHASGIVWSILGTLLSHMTLGNHLFSSILKKFFFFFLVWGLIPGLCPLLAKHATTQPKSPTLKTLRWNLKMTFYWNCLDLVGLERPDKVPQSVNELIFRPHSWLSVIPQRAQGNHDRSSDFTYCVHCVVRKQPKLKDGIK
jgi:hypothetical protein